MPKPQAVETPPQYLPLPIDTIEQFEPYENEVFHAIDKIIKRGRCEYKASAALEYVRQRIINSTLACEDCGKAISVGIASFKVWVITETQTGDMIGYAAMNVTNQDCGPFFGQLWHYWTKPRLGKAVLDIMMPVWKAWLKTWRDMAGLDIQGIAFDTQRKAVKNWKLEEYGFQEVGYTYHWRLNDEQGGEKGLS